MREDAGLDLERILACLNAHCDLRVASVTFLPLGHDLNAAVNNGVPRDGASEEQAAYPLVAKGDRAREDGLGVHAAVGEPRVPSLRGAVPAVGDRSGTFGCRRALGAARASTSIGEGMGDRRGSTRRWGRASSSGKRHGRSMWSTLAIA